MDVCMFYLSATPLNQYPIGLDSKICSKELFVLLAQ